MEVKRNIQKVSNGTSVDGLEQVFDAEIEPDKYPVDIQKLHDASGEGDTFWTPDYAARVLGKSVRSIRRLVNEGKLEGYKVEGKRGFEWRIKPFIKPVTQQVDVHPLLLSEFRERIDQLEKQLQETQKELMGAAHRNGYLEAQVSAKEEQIRLLMDRFSSRKWWQHLLWWCSAEMKG